MARISALRTGDPEVLSSELNADSLLEKALVQSNILAKHLIEGKSSVKIEFEGAVVLVKFTLIDLPALEGHPVQFVLRFMCQMNEPKAKVSLVSGLCVKDTVTFVNGVYLLPGGLSFLDFLVGLHAIDENIELHEDFPLTSLGYIHPFPVV